MKSIAFLSLLAFVSPSFAAPIDDATALLQSKKYPEAVAALASLPPEAGEKGFAAYLQALALHLGDKHAEAIAAADKVPADSPWGLKAKFLKAAALTKSKKHQEAEAIYAAEAARAFSPERRDALVKALLEFADEAVNPAAGGEVTPPQPDWKKAASLCEKVLDMPISADLRADVLYKKATMLQKSGDNAAAHAAYHAWLLLFDPSWSTAFDEGKVRDPAVKLHRSEHFTARLHLTECLLALGRYGDARLVAKELRERLAALPDGSIEKKDLTGDAAWLYVQTFAPSPQNRQQQRGNQAPAQQMMQQNDNNAPLLPPGVQGDAGQAGPLGSAFEQFANAVPFPQRATQPVFVAADYLSELRAFLASHPEHQAAPRASEAIAQTLDRDGKDVEAIAAWTEFIEGKNFKTNGLAAALGKKPPVPDPVTGLTPAESLLRRRQTAAFRIGQIHNDKRRYAEAIAQWQKYITSYPNGQEWQQAQSSIVDAEFQMGLTAVAAGDEKKAREVFDAFLARYPLDARARQDFGAASIPGAVSVQNLCPIREDCLCLVCRWSDEVQLRLASAQQCVVDVL